ncbi:MAG TPA: polysaccharide biosynthesis/export family protein [Bacillota bacterium]
MRFKKIACLFFLAAGLLIPIVAGAEPADYRLRPGDQLRFNLWSWGNQPLQQFETAVRPDGKVAVAFGIAKGQNYRLDAGDVLSIGVWGCGPELQQPEITVRPDGKISFPLVGEITAAGYTPVELVQKLTLALREYVKEPKVTVNVVKFRVVPLVGEYQASGFTLQELAAKIRLELSEYHPEARLTIEILKFGTTRVYVLGEVNKPGLCEIEKSHNLLDAIGAAGGFTKNADSKRVYLVRNGQTDSYTEINLDRLLKKGDLSLNYTLNDGDLVYFARNKVDFARDILPFINAYYQIRDLSND